MTVPFDPRAEWAREDDKPVAETIGSVFQRAFAAMVERERLAPFGGRDVDALFQDVR